MDRVQVEIAEAGNCIDLVLARPHEMGADKLLVYFHIVFFLTLNVMCVCMCMCMYVCVCVHVCVLHTYSYSCANNLLMQYLKLITYFITIMRGHDKRLHHVYMMWLVLN